VPDFPTPKVRSTSDNPNNKEEEAAQHSSPVLDDAPNTPEPAASINAESILAPEDSDRGRELGAEPTEPVVVEDSVGGGVPDDVAGGPLPSAAERCGAESDGAVPHAPSSWAAVAAEAVEIGTEIELATGEVVSKGGAGSGVVSDGEKEEQPISEAATPLDVVGPVETTADARQSDDADARVPETATAECSEEYTGPGAGSEAAHVEPEDILTGHAVDELTAEPEEDASGPVDVPERAQRPAADPDQVPAPTGSGVDESSSDSHVESEDETSETVTADHPVIETSLEPEEGSSGPDAVPEQAEHPTTDPELQGDGGQAPAPTVFGDEESRGPHLEDSVAAEGPESPARHPEDDAVGPAHQDIAPGTSSADAPEIGGSGSSTGEEGGSGAEEGADPLLGLDIATDGASSPGGDLEDDAVGTVAEDTAPAALDAAPDADGAALQSGQEESSTAPSPPDVADVGSSDRAEEESDAVRVATGAAEAETPKLDAGDVKRETLTVPAGPERVETDTSEGAAEDGDKAESETVRPVVDVTGIDGVEAGAETDVASFPAKGDVGGELEAPVDDATQAIPAPEREAPEPETGHQQPLEADDRCRELAENTAADGETGPGLEVIDQKPLQELDIQTDVIGGEDAYESDKKKPHADAGVGNDDGVSSKTLGSEIDIDETGAFPEDDGRKLETNNDVCIEPGTPGLQPSGKHIAPAIFVDDLTNISPGTLTPSTELLSAGTTAREGPVAAETPTQKPTPSPLPRQEHVKAKPQLAPIPDLSKLSSTPRDSVDTIRPSTDDEHRHPTLPKPPHTTTPTTTTPTSRPKTAGYLSIGLLRSEPRFIEVGLRGALGDVRARRMSLPLQQHLLDTESDTVARPPAPASDAGGVRGSRSRRSWKKDPAVAAAVGEHSNGWDDDQAAVLPRMMMMLAGAVALGKIMKRAAEGD
jgi:hypothetical protein